MHTAQNLSLCFSVYKDNHEKSVPFKLNSEKECMQATTGLTTVFISLQLYPKNVLVSTFWYLFCSPINGENQA